MNVGSVVPPRDEENTYEDACIDQQGIIFDDPTQSNEDNMGCEEINLRHKRQREPNDDEWQTVEKCTKKKPRSKLSTPREFAIQISVVSKEKLPKQFALAKLLKEHKILNISKVKYVNPFKLLITFDNESSAENFVACSAFTELGWKRHKTWEVGLSYGVVKDLDVDLSEEELLKHVSCEVAVVSAKRLNRRTQEGWTPCETVRFGFQGPSLPSHIHIMDLRVRVEPYVFPVTQCSKCWRFGHSIKVCPSNRMICPKCSLNHPNCEITSFKCSNCSGNHMALSRDCPVYQKEKRIRELMSEFSCTYQIALTLYVPHSSPPSVYRGLSAERSPYAVKHCELDIPPPLASYSEVTKTKVIVDKPLNPAPIKLRKRKKKVPYYLSKNTLAELEMTASDFSIDDSISSTQDVPIHDPRDNNESITSLIQKFKEKILKMRDELISTLKSWVKSCIDWVISFVLTNTPDMSMFKNLFSSLNNG